MFNSFVKSRSRFFCKSSETYLWSSLSKNRHIGKVNSLERGLYVLKMHGSIFRYRKRYTSKTSKIVNIHCLIFRGNYFVLKDAFFVGDDKQNSAEGCFQSPRKFLQICYPSSRIWDPQNSQCLSSLTQIAAGFPLQNPVVCLIIFHRDI